MRFKPPNYGYLQDTADARRQMRRRTYVLQVPDNKTDAVLCERFRFFYFGSTTAAWLDKCHFGA
jgi:hypothetical protein